MSLSLGVKLKDGRKVKAALARINLNANPAVISRGLGVTARRIRDRAEQRLKSGEAGLRRRTGTLFDSIETDLSDVPKSARIGTEVYYGSFWEFGSPRTRPPRPFLVPALNAVAPDIPGIFVREWEAAWNKSR